MNEWARLKGFTLKVRQFYVDARPFPVILVCQKQRFIVFLKPHFNSNDFTGLFCFWSSKSSYTLVSLSKSAVRLKMWLQKDFAPLVLGLPFKWHIIEIRAYWNLWIHKGHSLTFSTKVGSSIRIIARWYFLPSKISASKTRLPNVKAF